MPGGSLQQSHAQPGFQLLDRIGDGGSGQAKILGGMAETTPLQDSGENPHGFNPVHYYSKNPNSIAGYCQIIRPYKRDILATEDHPAPRRTQ
jgi:hypothetical protein